MKPVQMIFYTGFLLLSIVRSLTQVPYFLHLFLYFFIYRSKSHGSPFFASVFVLFQISFGCIFP